MSNANTTEYRIRSWADLSHKQVAEDFGSNGLSGVGAALKSGYAMGHIVIGVDGFYVPFRAAPNSGNKSFVARYEVARDGSFVPHPTVRQDMLDAKNNDSVTMVNTLKFALGLLRAGKALNKGVCKQLAAYAYLIKTIAGKTAPKSVASATVYEDIKAAAEALYSASANTQQTLIDESVDWLAERYEAGNAAKLKALEYGTEYRKQLKLMQEAAAKGEQPKQRRKATSQPAQPTA